MKKPQLDFFVPGFSKCGTTTLCSLLEQHPEIFIPKCKEPMFFNNRNYHNHWDKYAEFFQESKELQRLGEGTTFYSTKNNEDFVRRNLLQHYPNSKMIFIARDPIARIESSFREFHHSGPQFGVATPTALKDALEQLPAIVNDTLYWSRLSAYKEHMPEQNIHVMFLEDLKSNTAYELKKCFEFLEVNTQYLIPEQNQQLNTGSSKLYDSKLLRSLRETPIIGPWIAKYPVDTQDKYAKPLRLRKIFKHNIEWEETTISWLLDRFDNEMNQFLLAHGKAIDFWPKLKSLKEQLQ